jgi:hypothetical protein
MIVATFGKLHRELATAVELTWDHAPSPEYQGSNEQHKQTFDIQLASCAWIQIHSVALKHKCGMPCNRRAHLSGRDDKQTLQGTHLHANTAHLDAHEVDDGKPKPSLSVALPLPFSSPASYVTDSHMHLLSVSDYGFPRP